MRTCLTGVIALVAVCRVALGGEGAALPAIEPMGALFRILADFGMGGAFIIYMIWDKKRDREKREKDNERDRQKRDEESKRWYALDRELVGLVKECTLAISESTSVLTELRKDVWRLTSTSASERPTEIRPSRATQMLRRGEE